MLGKFLDILKGSRMIQEIMMFLLGALAGILVTLAGIAAGLLIFNKAVQ